MYAELVIRFLTYLFVGYKKVCLHEEVLHPDGFDLLSVAHSGSGLLGHASIEADVQQLSCLI